MNRRDRLLQGLDLRHGLGAEIGPQAKPLVKKSDGLVVYVDHADTQTIREKYRNDPTVDIDSIQVDVIWGEKTLREAIFGEALPSVDERLDYVVASHVIEHVPDVVTWLGEIREVLKSHGQLRLAVPDRRYEFDHLRRNSSLAEVLAAYVRRDRRPNAHQMLDYFLGEAPVDTVAAWAGQLDVAKMRSQRTHSLRGAVHVAQRAQQSGEYIDVHCWAFTPRSFAEICAELAANDVLGFACDSFRDTQSNECEFLVAMRPCADSAERAASWRRMARDVVG